LKPWHLKQTNKWTNKQKRYLNNFLTFGKGVLGFLKKISKVFQLAFLLP
jgi:hypothetical protein